VTQAFDNMNQPTGVTFSHDSKGNLCTNGGSSYTYDAQNRLTRAVVAGKSGNTTVDFYYDAKNRQIARSSSINGAVTFSVWDDWELVEEYAPGNVVTAKYLQGAHGPIKSLLNNVYYYQDSLGSTSHVASSVGALLEYYKYDLNGKPTYFAANGTSLPNGTAQGVVDLFAGERWIPEIGLYDDRNRFYDPGLGRFLQPDPIGFKGDASNLYRYCGNDWANRTDPMGLTDIPVSAEMDRLIWQACMNSLKAAHTKEGMKDGASRTQAIKGTRDHPALATNADGSPKITKGTLVVETARVNGQLAPTGQATRTHRVEDTGVPGPAAGHVHRDVTGKPKDAPGFSDMDRTAARGKDGKIIGLVNESNPKRVFRLTPQVEGGEAKPREIEPPKADPKQKNSHNNQTGFSSVLPDVAGVSSLLTSAGF
jgi:RHS repeat-associated protein